MWAGGGSGFVDKDMFRVSHKDLCSLFNSSKRHLNSRKDVDRGSLFLFFFFGTNWFCVCVFGFGGQIDWLINWFVTNISSVVSLFVYVFNNNNNN